MAENIMGEELDSNEREREQAAVINEHLELKTYNLIDQSRCGFIEDIQESYAKVRLLTTEEMAVDKRGLIHSGFVFAAANFAAIAAVNKPNVVLAVAKCNFLAPLKVEDEVIFEARAMQNTTRKRNVVVTGTILGRIKVFEGEFAVVVTDRHTLSLQLQEE